MNPLRGGLDTYAEGMLPFALFWLPTSAVIAMNGFAASSLVGNEDLLALWPGQPIAFYRGFLAVLLPSLVDAVFVIAFFGGVAAMVRAGTEGKPIRARDGFACLASRGRELFECGIVVAIVLGVAIAAPLLPALGAVTLNATMGLIFVWAGVAAGLALAFLAFKRFMFAPACIALGGLNAPQALRASGQLARLTRNGVFAVELTIVLAALMLLAGIPAAVGSVHEGRASMAGLAASVVAGAVMWPLVPVMVAHYHRAAERGELAAQPSLAARPALGVEERETACPRCGASVAFQARASGGSARCGACGLTGHVW